MHEQDESLIASGSDMAPSDAESHICTNPGTCMIEQSQDHLIPADDSSAPVMAVPEKISRFGKKQMMLAVAGLILVVVGGMSAFVYTQSASNKTVKTLASALPFPALMVGRNAVSYGEYYREQDSLKKYFASTLAAGAEVPTEAELHDMIVQTLTNKAVIQTLASNYGVTLSQENVEAFYQNFLDSNVGQASADVEKQLMDTFGWTVPEFKQRVVEPIVLSTQVGEFIGSSEYYQKPAQDAMREAAARVKNGEDFEAVGNETHERMQINLESDLGFIKKSQLPEVWASQVQDLEIGTVTDVIELPQGYAMFKVTERIKAQEAVKADAEEVADDQIHLYTITAPKMTIDQVVATYLQKVPVRVLIKV